MTIGKFTRILLLTVWGVSFGIYAQGQEYVLSGTVYGSDLGQTEKDVYVVAYRVEGEKDGFINYRVPSPQHAVFTAYKGTFKLILNARKSYMVEFAKEGYELHRLNFSSKEGVEGKEIGIEVALKEGDSQLFATEYVDAQTKEPLREARPIIIDSASRTRRVGVTDQYGKCYFPFEPDREAVVLQAHKSEYFWSEEEPLPLNRTTLGKGRQKSRELQPIQIGKWKRLPKFHFGINDDQLQPQGKEALSSLYRLMKTNPGLRVEVASHTDSRGDDLYNKLLSQKRADAAVDYLTELGISPTRLRPMGYGETQLLNECANGVRCDNKRHAENRRMAYMVYEIVE